MSVSVAYRAIRKRATSGIRKKHTSVLVSSFWSYIHHCTANTHMGSRDDNGKFLRTYS